MDLKSQRNLPAKNPVQPQTLGSINAELQAGAGIEHEHTQDDKLASKIAADHLGEDPHYYSKLMSAGLADEVAPKKGNSAPHVQTKPLSPAPRVNVNGTFVNRTTGASLPHFTDAEKKTSPLGSDSIEHFAGKIERAIALVKVDPADATVHEGGAKMMEPHAGITSDQEGNRWSINAYPDDKKVTPPMR